LSAAVFIRVSIHVRTASIGLLRLLVLLVLLVRVWYLGQISGPIVRLVVVFPPFLPAKPDAGSPDRAETKPSQGLAAKGRHALGDFSHWRERIGTERLKEEKMIGNKEDVKNE
jgi:hypothetical protein